MIKNVRCHVLRSWTRTRNVEIEGLASWSSAEFRNNYVAFTCLLAAPDEGTLYCGVTAFDNDILHAFDLRTRTFRSMGYPQVTEPFEIKVYRSLAMGSDGTIYGASACLHERDKRLQAPGGALCRLDPRNGSAAWLGKPSSAFRLPGLALWRDGLLLGVVGDDKQAEVFTYDREARSFNTLGPIVAPDDLALHRTHDIALVGDTLFVAETDVPERAAYL